MERYRGRVFRVLDEGRTLGILDSVDIFIISAKYGLLRDSDLIDYYDEIMTPSLALRHAQSASQALQASIRANNYIDCFIFLEPAYFAAVDKVAFPSGITHEVEISVESLYSLRHWLINPGARE